MLQQLRATSMQWSIFQPPNTHMQTRRRVFTSLCYACAPSTLVPAASRPHASALSLKQYVLGCSLHRVFRAMRAPPARLPNPNPEGRTSSTLHPNPEASPPSTPTLNRKASPSSTPQPNPGAGLSSSPSLNPEAAAGCLNPNPKGALSDVAARHITASLIDILDHLHSLGFIYAVSKWAWMQVPHRMMTGNKWYVVVSTDLEVLDHLLSLGFIYAVSDRMRMRTPD